ncbi:MerR family DNA-binding transcriptional regulator [Antrihabitans cavernicola]|uniref:MerR family transcriptional regulator n=1 Tax=Antrihabitans cavernicola TaxID=2495913 RepID=A0A5A7S3V8_9NOCA|nr:MerR family DNA-binding transcriptional regulator [Spelaeibacter cavernicola]KAA0018509.1 MerR family transcriptional regulator [Spelaeibacter cavernicola]
MLIGEVSRRCGVSTRMLRHYDRLGLVKPTGRTSGGYREYATDDIRRLFHVESLRTLGLSLAEAKLALDEPGFAPSGLVGDLMRHTRQRIAAEQELLERLERVDAASPAEWDEVLRTVTLLRALESASVGRQQAILTYDGSPPIDALVKAILQEDDANVAGALRWSLAKAGSGGLAGLARGLDAQETLVRRRAIAAIAAFDTRAADVHLRRALDDSDATVHEHAALALGARGYVDAMPALIEMVLDGRHDVEAAEALGALVADDVVAVLQAKIDDADWTGRLRITQALAEIPGTTAREALTKLTHDSDQRVASTAAAIVKSQGRSNFR